MSAETAAVLNETKRAGGRIICVGTTSCRTLESLVNEDGSFELPTTITVLVSVEQAKILANYEESAVMHVALVYRGDDATADKFLKAQDDYFTKKNVSEADKNG